jgi:hypothetical protein
LGEKIPHEGLVFKILDVVTNCNRSNPLREDLRQAGYLALWKSILKLGIENPKFSTYAWAAIKGEMYAELRRGLEQVHVGRPPGPAGNALRRDRLKEIRSVSLDSFEDPDHLRLMGTGADLAHLEREDETQFLREEVMRLLMKPHRFGKGLCRTSSLTRMEAENLYKIAFGIIPASSKKIHLVRDILRKRLRWYGLSIPFRVLHERKKRFCKLKPKDKQHGSNG